MILAHGIDSGSDSSETGTHSGPFGEVTGLGAGRIKVCLSGGGCKDEQPATSHLLLLLTVHCIELVHDRWILLIGVILAPVVEVSPLVVARLVVAIVVESVLLVALKVDG